jgi:cyclic nucleotide gated channel
VLPTNYKSNFIWFVKEYPEARESLLERGKQLLQKDGLIDDEALERERKAMMSTGEKIDQLGKSTKSCLSFKES